MSKKRDNTLKSQGSTDNDLPAKKEQVSWKIIVAVLLLLCIGIIAYLLDLPNRIANQNLAALSSPVFTRISPEKIFSTDRLMGQVGVSVEIAKTVPAVEGNLVTEIEGKPQSCPPELPTRPMETAGSVPLTDMESPRKLDPISQDGPKTIDTPVVVSKDPASSSASKMIHSESASKEQPESRIDASTKTAKFEKTDKDTESKATITTTASITDEKSRSEQFQLPGSLKIRIHDYSGTPVKWALMVILDDSASMTRKSKVWKVSKLDTAKSIIAEISKSLGPGSRLAVRDFNCIKSQDQKKGLQKNCLSRQVFDWAEAPFAGLKEKLEQVGSSGRTNPCNAAAFSLKKDFSELEHLTPRVLIISDGASKCAADGVVKALEQHKGKAKAGVDVIALGSLNKKSPDYTSLTKKCDGVLIKLEQPTDMETALTRYAKMLKTPAMEKIEVRGENAVFTMFPEEEITLTPGAYTVVLPVVAGLNPAKRAIENVKVNSGEASVVDVRIRKGRPTIKMSRK